MLSIRSKIFLTSRDRPYTVFVSVGGDPAGHHGAACVLVQAVPDHQPARAHDEDYGRLRQPRRLPQSVAFKGEFCLVVPIVTRYWNLWPYFITCLTTIHYRTRRRARRTARDGCSPDTAPDGSSTSWSEQVRKLTDLPKIMHESEWFSIRIIIFLDKYYYILFHQLSNLGWTDVFELFEHLSQLRSKTHRPKQSK